MSENQTPVEQEKVVRIILPSKTPEELDQISARREIDALRYTMATVLALSASTISREASIRADSLTKMVEVAVKYGQVSAYLKQARISEQGLLLELKILCERIAENNTALKQIRTEIKHFESALPKAEPSPTSPAHSS